MVFIRERAQTLIPSVQTSQSRQKDSELDIRINVLFLLIFRFFNITRSFCFSLPLCSSHSRRVADLVQSRLWARTSTSAYWIPGNLEVYDSTVSCLDILLLLCGFKPADSLASISVIRHATACRWRLLH
jgi:hypothetical protein